jgi:putative cardiolipin synthase
VRTLPFLSGFALLAVLLGSGCATPRVAVDKPVSHALQGTEGTQLGRLYADQAASHDGLSGLYLITSGLEAIGTRLHLADRAEASIDAQYYFVQDDTTGRLFIERLLRAADRGVRVRLLLDDIVAVAHDPGLAALNSHPNIEVRVFNPFARREARLLDFLFDFARVNRRMHNKSFTVDNQVSIVGGRNIGDEYFEAREDLDFGDLDLLAFGPVVNEVSAAFDAYWNSTPATPIEALVSESRRTVTLDTLRTTLQQNLETAKISPYRDAVASTQLLRATERPRLLWCRTEAVYDLPEKVTRDRKDRAQHLGPLLAPYLINARSELVLISPYFVPGRRGVELLRGVRSNGAEVIVVTNSLASTDVSAVHAGYAPYRKPLLEGGIALHEVRPDPDEQIMSKRGRRGSTRSSLHAKAILFDRRWIYVGSFNLDPRSLELNTEMGLLSDCPELARSRAQEFIRDLDRLTYRVALDADGNLAWHAVDGQDETVHTSEPEVGFWRQLGVRLMGLLPIEDQL